MDATTQNALAKEAQRIELKQKVAKLQGLVEAQASLATLLSVNCGDSSRRLQAAQNELTALEAGAGPGISDIYGAKADHLKAFIDAASAAGLITDADAARTLAGI
jgi:hypothetical protein